MSVLSHLPPDCSDVLQEEEYESGEVRGQGTKITHKVGSMFHSTGGCGLG